MTQYYRCLYCDVQLDSPESWADHLRSERHQGHFRHQPISEPGMGYDTTHEVDMDREPAFNWYRGSDSINEDED